MNRGIGEVVLDVVKFPIIVVLALVYATQAIFKKVGL